MKPNPTQPLASAKEAYIAPTVERETITIENGFAQSSNPENSASRGYDYFDNGEDY
jgi:hypothetical protein